MNNIAFIALGSNLNSPENQLKIAIEHIKSNSNIYLIKTSSFYNTKPYGYQKQDNFVNAVIKIQTNLTSVELLKFLQHIEQIQKRVREIKWGPRTIDLDILAYNRDIINTKELIIPHQDYKNRDFVLTPWHEIDPNWIMPCGSTISDIRKQMLLAKHN